MKLQKTFKIESITFLPENRYILETGFPRSTLRFDDKTLEAFGISLEKDYTGRNLVVYLEDGRYTRPPYANELMISEVAQYVHRIYGPKIGEKPFAHSTTGHIVKLHTWPTMHIWNDYSSNDLIESQFPSFDLTLPLTEEEYQEMLKLSDDAIMFLKKLEIKQPPEETFEEEEETFEEEWE